MGRFHDDTAVTKLDESLWRGEIREGWRIGAVPNGGYVLSIGARALSEALPQPDPMTITAYYMAPTVLGPIDCRVEELGGGRSTSFGQVRLEQDGQLKALITGAFTNLNALTGEDWQAVKRPEYPPLDDCELLPKGPLEFRQNLDQFLCHGGQVFTGGEPDGSGEFRGWLRHADGTATDLISLLLFADCFPPPAFNVFGVAGWVPTVELTVQLRAHPAPGPVQARLYSHFMTGGVVEEDGEYWDSEGKLVAVSRQTAKFRRPKG